MQTVVSALVLRRSEYRDYDRMVTLLSPTMGRIDAVVRGCRKPKSPLMNAAEVFCAGEYTITEVKGRYTVTQCQISESFYPLRTDYEKLTHAAYYLHLLNMATLPGESAEGLFHLALRALAHLSYGDLPPALLTLAFELHYMNLMGQAPRMDGCVRCGRAIDGDALFDVKRGGAVCLNCESGQMRVSNGARRILMRVPMTKFDAVEKLDGHLSWPEAAVLMRRFMEYRIDQPPKAWPALQGEGS